jgi:aspartate kinase
MLSVLKVGGSVLRDEASYAATAGFLRNRLAEHPDERLVVIVSAQHGTTDELLAEAEAITPQPGYEALDLLWSTGELRSVARLTLHLQRIGVGAIPFNVHQTGLVACPEPSRGPDPATGTSVRPARLLAALAAARIVVVPGFLGVSAGDTITSLGRGGSDLTAVLLAAAVQADACELIKDVPGYYTADPHRDSKARQIHDLAIEDALRMADGGCDLVQRAALAAAAQADLHVVIRSMDAAAPVTHVHASIERREIDQKETSRNNRSTQYGVRHQDDPRRAAVRA